MSTHFEAERKLLNNLVNRAAAKEQRVLRFSIVFAVLAIAGGFALITYSAKRVIRLEQRRADLETTIHELEAQKTALVRDVTSEVERTRTSATNIVEGTSDAKQQARDVLASLSNVQDRLQVALDERPTTRTVINPTPTPTPTPPQSTSVPDLKGLTLRAAQQKLRQLGLTMAHRVQEGRGTPGTVLYQDPPLGSRVNARSTVTVYVLPVSVPEVRSLTAEAASQKLRSVGFEVLQKAQQGRGVPGTVLYQDPIAGTRMPAGSAVSIYIISPRQNPVETRTQ